MEASTDLRGNKPSSRLLSPAILGLWLGGFFGYFYVTQVALPSTDQRITLLHDVLNGTAKSDFVFAMYAIARVHRFLADHLPIPERWIFALIDFAGIVFLFECATLYLVRTFAQTPGFIAAVLWLATTSPLLLIGPHYYHPSDFYATGLMFLILQSARDQAYRRLAVLCLLSGILWEKTLFVPALYWLWECHRSGWTTATVRAAPSALAILFWFVLWRVAFPDSPRVLAHETWGQFLPTLRGAGVVWIVWTGPLLAILGDTIWNRRTIDRFWWIWLLYWPILVGVLIGFRGFLDELRSFWIMQPIFAGVVADWANEISRKNQPSDMSG